MDNFRHAGQFLLGSRCRNWYWIVFEQEMNLAEGWFGVKLIVESIKDCIARWGTGEGRGCVFRGIGSGQVFWLR